MDGVPTLAIIAYFMLFCTLMLHHKNLPPLAIEKEDWQRVQWTIVSSWLWRQGRINGNSSWIFSLKWHLRFFDKAIFLSAHLPSPCLTYPLKFLLLNCFSFFNPSFFSPYSLYFTFSQLSFTLSCLYSTGIMPPLALRARLRPSLSHRQQVLSSPPPTLRALQRV